MIFLETVFASLLIHEGQSNERSTNRDSPRPPQFFSAACTSWFGNRARRSLTRRFWIATRQPGAITLVLPALWAHVDRGPAPVRTMRGSVLCWLWRDLTRRGIPAAPPTVCPADKTSVSYMSVESHIPSPRPIDVSVRRIALSAEEVADVLGISRSHVFRLASSGRLPRSLRLGRAVRWDLATLEAWLAAGAPPRERWERMQTDSRCLRGGKIAQ